MTISLTFCKRQSTMFLKYQTVQRLKKTLQTIDDIIDEQDDLQQYSVYVAIVWRLSARQHRKLMIRSKFLYKNGQLMGVAIEKQLHISTAHYMRVRDDS